MDEKEEIGRERKWSLPLIPLSLTSQRWEDAVREEISISHSKTLCKANIANFQLLCIIIAFTEDDNTYNALFLIFMTSTLSSRNLLSKCQRNKWGLFQNDNLLQSAKISFLFSSRCNKDGFSPKMLFSNFLFYIEFIINVVDLVI